MAQSAFAFSAPQRDMAHMAPSARPYQLAALQAIRAAADRGVRRQLVVLATGMGKTYVASRLLDVLGVERMLWLAHRYELLEQAREHLQRANPLLNVEVEQADRYADRSADVVVASIPTLGPKSSKRLETFDPTAFGVVVHDESHHISSDTALRVLRYFRCGEADGPVLVGLTATPFRGDGVPLSNVFDEVVYEKGLREGIEENWLCRVRAVRVKSQTDLSNVSTRLGDFAETELATAANTDLRNSLIASAIEDHAQGRNTILVFAINIAHVEALTAQLRQRGHAAECVTAHTHSNDRWKIFKRIRDGETRMLVNCGITIEGWDCPSVDCIVMCRPTKSTVLYTQMFGRGTRQSPDTGKVDLLVVDIVDVCGRHKVQTASAVFGMRDVDLLGGDALEAAKVCERAEEAGVAVEDGDTVEEVERKAALRELLAKRTIRVETMAQAIDLFDASHTASEVERESLFPWVRAGRERYVLPIDGPMCATLSRDALGIWKCQVGQVGGENVGTGGEPPFKAADKVVKRYAGTFYTKDKYPIPRWKQLAHDAKWRRDKPREHELRMLNALGIKLVPPGVTRGAVCELISHLRVGAMRQ